MNQTVQAIIFDLDGTLLDTIGDLADCGNHVLRMDGFPVHSEDAYKRMVGDGISELVARMLPEPARHPVRIARMVERLEAVYETRWNVRTRIYDGITDCLDELVRRGFRMGVLSNKPHRFTVEMVGAFLSDWHFDPLWGARDHCPKKPDPSAALAIARDWNLSASNCMMVGDSEPDIRTAKAAGMVSVAVTWGFRSRDRLRAENPDFLIDHPLELPACLETAHSMERNGLAGRAGMQPDGRESVTPGNVRDRQETT